MVQPTDTGDSYCCLGVLCEVAGLKHDNYHFEEGGDRRTGVLPEDTEIRVGLYCALALDVLMRMNDNGKSFAEIADYIEANL